MAHLGGTVDIPFQYLSILSFGALPLPTNPSEVEATFLAQIQTATKRADDMTASLFELAADPSSRGTRKDLREELKEQHD